MLNKALIAGSFDPITYGHLDLVSRALNFLDEVTLALGVNSTKNPLFSDQEKLYMMAQSTLETLGTKLTQRVKLTTYNNLLADYAKDNDYVLLVRGARNATDFEYEYNLAQINKKLNPALETIILPANPSLNVVSSSVVRELAKFGRDCSEFVTPSVALILKNKFQEKK